MALSDSRNFSPDTLRKTLGRYVPPAAGGLLVALGGGEDSACLLTALVQLRYRALPLRAVHVDHGLQSAAADLSHGCVLLCRGLGVPLEVAKVAVARAGGDSLEAAARAARYGALGEHLRPGECLVTAHHAQDQAETLLLQLLRGAGTKGAAAMPVCRTWRGGWHLRPLLAVSKSAIRAYAAAAGVPFVVDPMNGDMRFDRAYLRDRIWPLMEARWPGAAIALSRAARHSAEAQELLDDSAAASLRILRDGEGLSVTGLRALPAREQHTVLRHWIRSRGAEPPETARLNEALRQVMDSRRERLPSIAWGCHALRRYRNQIFLTADVPPRLATSREWRRAEGPLELGAGQGRLEWVAHRGGLDAQRLPEQCSVRRRRGGETLRAQRHAHSQTLQHLCQASGVLPWMRDSLPLIYAGDALVAVGDLWLDARWCVAPGMPGLACKWHGGPLMV